MADSDADYRDAVLQLAATLPDGVTWAVSGSANLALQGVDPDSAPGDVDVVCDEPGAYAIEAAFPGAADELVHYREDVEAGIASHYGALVLDGVRVEIVGDTHYRVESREDSDDEGDGDAGAKWVPGADVAEHREFVDVDGTEVPVVSLEAEREGYAARDEDEKVALLDEHL